MGTITAIALYGKGHPNHGGIMPVAELSLSENSRPTWILTPRDGQADGSLHPVCSTRVWIPSEPQHILEDGLLMLQLCLRCESDLVQQAQGLIDLQATHQDLSAVDSYRLFALRDQARRRFWPAKLVLSVLSNSSLLNQLAVVEAWSPQFEILTPKWWRRHTQWEVAPSVGGSLTTRTPGGRSS
ncbi:MAG: hypothetical protein QY320_05250 [Gammaproteobacteria bacterium]|nr:MAG: hypothetical protein QY320_05250 [Gammaproteobacteria bacterium]